MELAGDFVMVLFLGMMFNIFVGLFCLGFAWHNIDLGKNYKYVGAYKVAMLEGIFGLTNLAWAVYIFVRLIGYTQ